MEKKSGIQDKASLVNKIILWVCAITVTTASVTSAVIQVGIANRAAAAESDQIVTYSVSYRDTETEQTILDGEKSTVIHMSEPSVTIESGALKSLAAIGYDGVNIYFNQPLDAKLDEAVPIPIEAHVSESPLIRDGILYDYLFLYVEPMSGNPSLDLLCAEISLEDGSVLQTYQYRRLNLLELEPSNTLDGAKKVMLENYKKLTIYLSNL